MAEPPEIMELRTALARACRHAARHPDDDTAAAAEQGARLTYAVERSMHDLRERLAGMSLDGVARDRIRHGLAKIIGEAS